MRLRGAAAPLVALLLAVAAAAPARAADAAGTATVVANVTGQQLDVRLTATQVPAGAVLDAATVQVSVDGQPVQARVVDGSGQVGPALPPRALLLALDASGSMRGSGLAAARQAAAVLLAGLPDDVGVGLVAFDGKAHLLVAPTRDRAAVRRALAAVQADAGDTALYDALVLAAKTLTGAGQSTLVVLSDGADTASRADETTAAAALRRSAAQVRLVAFRTPDGQTQVLTALARAVGGEVVTAADAGQLSAAFGHVARGFDRTVTLTAGLPAGVATGSHRVHVALRFGAAAYQADAAVSVTAAAAPAVPTPTAAAAPPLPARSAPVPFWLLGLVFFALALLSATLLLPWGGDRRRRMKDLEFYTLSGRRQRTPQQERPSAKGITEGLLGLSERLVEQGGRGQSLALRLDRADVRLRPHEWFVVQVGAVVAGAVLLAILSGHVVVGAVLGALVGWLGPVVYLRTKTSRRLAAFQDGLPETLQLVAGSLRSGFSLSQALDAAVQDGRQPLAGEFARALAEARLGAPVEDALDRVADRMRSMDFHWVVMAIRVQHQVGGNLAEVLETTVRTMRERAAMRRQVRALSAEGRLSGYVLIALPIGMFAYMFLTRRDYLDALWTTGLGLVLSAAAVVLTTVGWFWMRKVAQVEV